MNAESSREALKAVERGDFYSNIVDRAKSGERPGAEWQIFPALHADTIRTFLHKLAIESNEPVDKDSDPIHDQDQYLDLDKRHQLKHEYNVSCCSFVQYMGDVVFIPAGAPHQVRNLNSCIKAAEDFVSPENIKHCFCLTQEFRHLSEKHNNHEDKLQIKNIIFHAMKDAASLLKHADPTTSTSS